MAEPMSKEQTIVHAACPHDCPDTCAMLVTVENGKATKVRGDPDHPFTQGGLCVKVNDHTHHTYSPNRVLYPLRRVGRKGEGQFERISWDEALDEIATRFRAIINEYGGQAILPYSYLGTEGILNGLTVGDPFFHRLGATVSERTFCDSGATTAYLMTLGPAAGMDPESFVHSKFIILWACNIRSTNLHMWPFVKEAQDRGAKVVVIDPLRHRTAQSADWYIPIRPGTDGALALAMMHVIINEGLIDKDYVAQHTVGFEELSERVQQYPPDWASAVTGMLGLDPPVKALFVYNSNPVVVAPQQEKTLAGLRREDLFTVVSEQFLTDTADYADIVLPATTQLEQFDIMFSWGHCYASINNPAIEPLGEAVPNVEMFRRLSERLGLEDDWYRLEPEEMAERVYDWSA